MQRLAVVIEFAVVLFQAPAAAQDIPPQSDFRATPPALNLLENQWTTIAPAPSGYTLEFLRTASRESAQLSLKDAVLLGLKNNPGIEVERLEPLRVAEQTLAERSIFDPTLSLDLRKTYSVDLYGTAASPFFQPVQRSQNRDWDLTLKKLFVTGTQLDLSFLNNRFVGSLPNQVLKPQYRSRLGFSPDPTVAARFRLGLDDDFRPHQRKPRSGQRARLSR